MFTMLLSSTLKVGMILCLNKFEFHLTKNTCAKFGWKWPDIFKKNSKICQYIFIFPLLIPLRKRGRSFIWTKLNIPNQMMFYCKFAEIREDVVNIFSLCCYYLNLTTAPHLNKLEFSSQIWMFYARWGWNWS